MAGRISDRDIAAIRERVRIEDVVGEYVQLRRAGADSMKGLCPFHDEKSPSFHVGPTTATSTASAAARAATSTPSCRRSNTSASSRRSRLLADRIGYTISYTGRRPPPCSVIGAAAAG